jgi:hypothetical protein
VVIGSICQKQKDFNKKIKNIKHDLMLNEYPQVLADCIMKPLRSNCPSDTIYQGTIITPYGMGVSEKFRWIGNISVSGPFSKLNIHSVKH